jgi:hypothetical protein
MVILLVAEIAQTIYLLKLTASYSIDLIQLEPAHFIMTAIKKATSFVVIINVMLSRKSE